jgi:dTMP kinase
MAAGTLVVLEGAEGVGKTTQARLLVEHFAAAGVRCVQLREPGGTSVGEAVRKVLLDPAHTPTPATEALLFVASRAQLVSERILPALNAGEVVILDRFFLSTYAYQVHGRGLPESAVRAANSLAVGALVPDVTLLLDLPVAEGLGRADRRSARDRMEQAGEAFHERVGAAFRSFANPEWQASHPECGRVMTVDASGSEDEVFRRILDALRRCL